MNCHTMMGSLLLSISSVGFAAPLQQMTDIELASVIAGMDMLNQSEMLQKQWHAATVSQELNALGDAADIFRGMMKSIKVNAKGDVVIQLEREHLYIDVIETQLNISTLENVVQLLVEHIR